MCWRGPHAKGLKFPWRDLEQWWCICFVWISMPIVAWYDFEMISRKSAVEARECVSFIHYDITYGKGCIAWNASVHICWSLMLWHIVAMMMTWFFLFFVHAYMPIFLAGFLISLLLFPNILIKLGETSPYYTNTTSLIKMRCVAFIDVVSLQKITKVVNT